MRCEECLPVLEEYFDGELETEIGNGVAAHLAACAECSEAFDALEAEQAVFARYTRDIEPSPALWQAVSARIAAEKETAAAPQAPPFGSRLRGALAGLFAAPRFNFGPALAGSFALVAVCALAGWLLLNAPPRRGDETASAPLENAAPQAAPEVAFMPEIPDPKASAKTSDERAAGRVTETSPAAAPYALRADAPRREARPSPVNGSSVVLASGSPAVYDHEHPTPQPEVLAEMAGAPAGAEELIRRPLNSLEDIEVARHLEKAQLLLRSFKNADEGDSADLAYEKRVSKELLSENIVLRRESEGSPTTTKQLLNTLEPFLLDIANLEDKPSQDDVRVIKERMQKKEIIAALRVY